MERSRIRLWKIFRFRQVHDCLASVSTFYHALCNNLFEKLIYFFLISKCFGFIFTIIDDF